MPRISHDAKVDYLNSGERSPSRLATHFTLLTGALVMASRRDATLGILASFLHDESFMFVAGTLECVGRPSVDQR
jgi:hypothetical protein